MIIRYKVYIVQRYNYNAVINNNKKAASYSNTIIRAFQDRFISTSEH